MGMRRVRELRYDLIVHKEFGRIADREPLSFATEHYRARLSDNILTIEMIEELNSVDLARERVEPDLKAWSLDASLDRDHIWLEFDFDPNGTTFEESSPSPSIGGPHATAHASVVMASIGVSGVAVVTPPVFSDYPKPPTAFKYSEDLRILFERYQRAVWEDESSLLSVGYACLSFLERATGKKNGARASACELFRIHPEVRERFGDLVSESGDMTEARKLDHEAKLVPLTSNERLWVRSVIKAMIRRKAEYDHCPAAVHSLPEITMAHPWLTNL